MSFKINALVFSALSSLGFLANSAFADDSFCSPTAEDAAGFVAKAHLVKDGSRVFVQVSDAEQIQILDGRPLTTYRVTTTLPAEAALTYVVRVNSRTCRVVSVELQD